MKSSREPSLPNWLARTLVVSLVAVIVLMPVHALLSTWGGTTVGPLWLWKSWKEIVLLVAGLATASWVLWNASVRKIVLRDRLMQLVLAYTVLTILWALLHFPEVGAQAAAAGMAANLRYILIASIAFVVFRFTRWRWSDISSKMLTYLVVAGALLAVLGLLQVTVLPRDLLTSFGYEKNMTIAPFMTVDENPNALRAFATLRGPNDFGAFLILPLVACLVFFKRAQWKLVATAIVASGIVASLSRSAWIGVLVAVIALLTLTYGTEFLRSRKFAFSGIVGLCVITALLFSAMTVPALRLAIFRSSPGDTSLTEGSTDQHLLATTGGLARVAENPLGCGVGCAGPASYYGGDPKISENYYVQIAEEVGVVGLVLWLAIAWQVARRLYEQRQDLLARALLASFAGLSVIGLWLHVWSDDPLSLTWWGFAGATLGYYASASRRKPVR